MPISIEFALNIDFESSMPYGSGITVFCECAIVIENIKNEYFIFDPHSSRCISGLRSGSGACHLSIHKLIVELCYFLHLFVN
jgi:hypothetical protein